MERIISTCDREADVYEYLSFKVEKNERFVVRASWDRNVEVDAESDAGEVQDKHLFAVVARCSARCSGCTVAPPARACAGAGA